MSVGCGRLAEGKGHEIDRRDKEKGACERIHMRTYVIHEFKLYDHVSNALNYDTCMTMYVTLETTGTV